MTCCSPVVHAQLRTFGLRRHRRYMRSPAKCIYCYCENLLYVVILLIQAAGYLYLTNEI